MPTEKWADPICISAVEKIITGTHKSADLGFLISHIRPGKGFEPLNRLLESDIPGAVTDGAYILSEIGQLGTPFLETAAKLLESSEEQTRYWALDSIISCGSVSLVKELIAKNNLLSDGSDMVREKAERYVQKHTHPGYDN